MRFFVLACLGVGFGWAGVSGESQSPARWMKPGVDGRSCVACHTPSGREIWDSPISIGDVRRRGFQHLTGGDVVALADSVAELRGSLKVSARPLSPFQPAGALIEGKTVAERDDAFGRSLEKVAPRLWKGEVWTLAEAEAAMEELCSKPLTQVQPGFALDPISRDPYRLLDGPALGDWIPDIPLSQAGTVAFIEACRAPGGTDIPAIDAAILKVEGQPKSTIEQLSRLKRLALLRLESQLETGRQEGPIRLSPGLPEDPVWAVGHLVSQTPMATPESWGMDAAVAKRAGVEMGKPMDLRPMALSWMWVGWMIDPSLQRTSGDRFTKFGVYLTQMLWDAGPYPWHAAYFASRRSLETRKLAVAGEALQPEINVFVNRGILEQNAPKDSVSKTAFVRYCGAVLRMDCLLVERDLAEGCKLAFPSAARQQLGELWKFVGAQQNEDEKTRTEAIVSRVLAKLG